MSVCPARIESKAAIALLNGGLKRGYGFYVPFDDAPDFMYWPVQLRAERRTAAPKAWRR